MASLAADARPRVSDHQCHKANDQCGQPDWGANESEGDTHCKGIDTGGHREDHQAPTSCGIKILTPILRMACLPDHPQTQESQETKCNPVINGPHVG